MDIIRNSAGICPLVIESIDRPFGVECFESQLKTAVGPDWKERSIDVRRIPDTIPEFEWLTDEQWREVRRNPLGYLCHDAALIREKNETLEVMVCVRSLTGRIEGGLQVHATPIEGWLWFPGGRNQNDCSPTREFDAASLSERDLASLMKVLNRETGIVKGDCISLWNLGIGKTFFPRKDIYVREPWGVEFAMEEPQVTHNAIYVLQVDDNFIPVGRSIEGIRWITHKDYMELRSEFCPYMQECLDAIFAGWNQ